MARLSKSKAFAIYEDNRIQTVDDRLSGNEDAGDADDGERKDGGTQDEEEYASTSIIDYAAPELSFDSEAGHEYVELADAEADDERRESAMTSTTISSFPDSYYWTENDEALNPYISYSPPVIRTRFRRPESVRRMQMSSPPPYGYRSPRQSILSHSRSRIGTPRSVRSANARGSPRMKKQVSKEDEDMEPQHFPLVLLHISLLPLNAPWSVESMKDLLPPSVIENLQLLRSKLSETMLQRGVLIPHPREEYELLEERLLEALELQEERVTKCGHFFHQLPRSSEASNTDSERGSDSGIGSSADSLDKEICAICQSHIKPSKSGVGPRNRKWMIKVYAANGLMRSAAWAAAWSEMERVDVEILPWMNDDIRQRLDERRVREEAARQDLIKDEESNIIRLVDEHVQTELERRLATIVTVQQQQLPASRDRQQPIIAESMRPEPPAPPLQSELPSINPDELPAIYRPSQIPVSILLKNYVFLLAQDQRNLVIFALSIAVVFFASLFGSRTNQAMLTPYAASLVEDVPIAATASSWILTPSSYSSFSKETATAALDTIPLDTVTRMNSTQVGSPFDGSQLSSDGESGVATSGGLSCPWTQMRSPDNAIGWAYHMCPVGAELG